jgi:hypothetical protein
MGTKPHFDLWNHFFSTRLRSGSDVEVVVWGSADILVWSRSGVDPYFCFPMSDPPAGWRKVWFFLRNDADMPLPVFMGGHPIPHPNWEYGVAGADLHRLQPLVDIVRELSQRGLMSAEILQTFFSRGVQMLRQ